MATLEDLSRTRESSVGGGVAGILGIGIPVVGVVVLPIWDFPATGSTGEQIRDFVVGDRVALQWMMAAYTVGITLWLVFGAVVWARLRLATAQASLPMMFVAGTVAYTTLLLAGFTVFDLLVRRPPGPEATTLYYDLTFGLLAMSGMPTAVALGAYAAVVYGSSGQLPRLTAHLAVLAAAAHVLLLLSFVVPTGFFSLQGLVIAAIPAPLWAPILVTGIALTSRRWRGKGSM